MAKNISKAGSHSTTPQAPPKAFAAPSGFQQQSGDLFGFYDANRQEPILFVPLEAKAFDSKIEPTKPSVLIVAKLLDSATVMVGSGDMAEEAIAPAGALIGIWAKPGMKALRNLRGAQVWMVWDGQEIDTGKPNKMKIFQIASKGQGAPLTITEDMREESVTARTVLDAPGRKTQAQPQPGPGGFTSHATDPADINF